MYVLSAEVCVAWKAHVCLSTSACQQTTASVYANLATPTTYDTLEILNNKMDFFIGPLGLGTTADSILSFDFYLKDWIN